MSNPSAIIKEVISQKLEEVASFLGDDPYCSIQINATRQNMEPGASPKVVIDYRIYGSNPSTWFPVGHSLEQAIANASGVPRQEHLQKEINETREKLARLERSMETIPQAVAA